MIYALIGGGVFVIVGLWAISVSNRFKVLLVKISEAEAGIDIALTKRFDTLTKMMDTVKAFAKHEQALFTEVVNLRKGSSIAEKSEANACLDKMMNQINVTAEAYPELRSSDNYVTLKSSIADTERNLQAARRLYNSNVSAYNQAIVKFPASIIAGSRTPKDFFETDRARHEDVKINL